MSISERATSLALTALESRVRTLEEHASALKARKPQNPAVAGSPVGFCAFRMCIERGESTKG